MKTIQREIRTIAHQQRHTSVEIDTLRKERHESQVGYNKSKAGQIKEYRDGVVDLRKDLALKSYLETKQRYENDKSMAAHINMTEYEKLQTLEDREKMLIEKLHVTQRREKDHLMTLESNLAAQRHASNERLELFKMKRDTKRKIYGINHLSKNRAGDNTPSSIYKLRRNMKSHSVLTTEKPKLTTIRDFSPNQQSQASMDNRGLDSELEFQAASGYITQDSKPKFPNASNTSISAQYKALRKSPYNDK